MDQLDEGKKSIIPQDGMMYSSHKVNCNHGDTVFDILLRETKSAKIALDFDATPGNSKYIKGIGNLYQLDCGNLSGWTYSVNGEFVNVGCSDVTLQDGDKIEWHYTCDLGRDLVS